MSGSGFCGLLGRPGGTPTVWASFLVHFRYVVFHPFLDEILIGKIKGCSPEGVHGKALISGVRLDGTQWVGSVC